MGVTVAAAGTLYTMIEDQQEAVESQSSELQDLFNTDILNVENCWYENDRVKLQVRNGQSQNAINASQINVFYEFEQVEDENLQIDSEIVNPQETFQIEIEDDDPEETPTVELSNSGDLLTERCFGISPD